jgi:hypothetical protein
LCLTCVLKALEQRWVAKAASRLKQARDADTVVSTRVMLLRMARKMRATA